MNVSQSVTWVWWDHIEKHKRLQGPTIIFLLQAPQLSKKKSTNGLLAPHTLRIPRVLVLHRHHAEHCSNLRDQKDFVFAKKFKNIASGSGCF